MQEVFQIKDPGHYSSRNQRDFVIPAVKLVNYGLESIRFLGRKIWESLPNNLENKDSIESFKMVIKKWKPESCPDVSVKHTWKKTKQDRYKLKPTFISFVIDFLNPKKYWGIGPIWFYILWFIF